MFLGQLLPVFSVGNSGLSIFKVKTEFLTKNKKSGSRKVPKITPKKHSKWVPNRGGYFLEKSSLLDPARTHFAAGTLLDLDFSSFWLRFEPQKHVFGPLDSLLWGAFCCCLWICLGRVHGGAQIVPEKNRESFPLSANVFWCWLRMLLLAEYWGCSNN